VLETRDWGFRSPLTAQQKVLGSVVEREAGRSIYVQYICIHFFEASCNESEKQ